MANPPTLPGLRMPAFFMPWLLVPALVLVCLQTAWLGVRLAAGAAPGAVAVGSAVLPVGDPSGHMSSADCMSCHETQPVLSHPVNVAPGMRVPARFPLENGQINCITCHQDTLAAHGGAGDHAMLRGGGAAGQAFCAACHTSADLTRQNRHPSALSQAHLVWPNAARNFSANAVAAGHDDGVNSCLSCHDGTVAPDAFGGLMAASGNFQMQGSNKGHAVGVAYPLATLRHGEARFRPAGAIDCRIRLTGGQVTCNSCHSLYSKEPGLLVLRNDNSGLCLSCHAQ